MTQLRYLYRDLLSTVGKNKYRLLFILFTRSFIGILTYRIERSFYLILGKWYKILRLPFIPILMILQAFTNVDIHYKADIKGGIKILHPSMGCVISGCSIIGENLTLIGGNVIGIAHKCTRGHFLIGHNCMLGANAVIIGPIKLGDNISIGASACVVKECIENNITLVGVPARIWQK